MTILVFGITYGQEKQEKFTIQKKTWSIEGDFSMNYSDSEDMNNGYLDKQNNFNIGFFPKLGYAIKDNLIVGLGLGYRYYKIKSDNINDFYYNNSLNSYSINPYIKKYIPIGKNLAFNIQGEMKFSTDKNKHSQLNTDFKMNTIFIGIRPGITYRLSKKVAIQTNIGSLGYTNMQSKINDIKDLKSNSFNLNFNTSDLYFGITLFI